MSRKPRQITIEEISGNHYASIEAAQLAALDDLSLDLTRTIRDLLASGRLVNLNGQITLNPNR